MVKTWKESSQSGPITHVQTTCPDPACQKIIDEQFDVQKKKRELIEKERQERTQARENHNHTTHVSISLGKKRYASK